jgi:hypothetical protein
MDANTFQWRRKKGKLRGIELVCGDKSVAALNQMGLFGLSRYEGRYEDAPIQLRVRSDWHDLTDKITITRTDTGDRLGVVTVYGIFQDGTLTMNDGREYGLRNEKVGRFQGYYVTDAKGRNLALTLADFFSHDFSMPDYYFKPLDITPGDPNQWLLAAITLHFVLRFNFPS